MNRITEKIYLWCSNDRDLYSLAMDCESEDELRDAFIEYVRPFDQPGAFVMDILTDVLQLVDWQQILVHVQD